MATPLLTLKGIRVAFGAGPPVLDGVDLALQAGDRACLVGRNGSGKSTLMRILAGLQPPDEGERVTAANLRVAYLPQQPDLGAAPTVHAYVAAALPADEADELYRVDAALDGLGVDGARAPATLSGGEARRADLARVLVSRPDLLLLDEPTNHLDLPAIEWLEAELMGHRGALVVVSHDRAFLAHLTGVTLWLDRGMVRRNPRGFEHFEAWSETLLEQEEAERTRMEKLIERETLWSREGISARRKRNQGRLRRLHALRDERAAWRSQAGRAKADLRAGELSGRIVIEAKGLTYRWPSGGEPVVRGLDLTVLRGDRVGLIGPNGAGKTTLLRLLTGELAPDTGTVRLGTNLTPSYFDQRRADLDDGATLWDTLTGGAGDQVMVHGRPQHVIGYLRDWLFDGRDARRAVGSLSGGERARLILARAFARPSNLLILDEPTNDLDLETLDLLEELLGDYPGTVLLVSHDRDFLDRVVTSTLSLEGGGRVVERAGGYSDLLAQRRGEAIPPPPAAPARAPAPPPRDERPRPKGKTRLSNYEERELAGLPDRIAELEATLVELEAALADGDFYARDPKGFQETLARLDRTREALAAAEERWLELEMVREGQT